MVSRARRGSAGSCCARWTTTVGPSGGGRSARSAATGGPGALVIAVSDDGVGGSALVPQHGLAGAAERRAGLGGTLVVSSPSGGPTQVTASIPLAN